MSKTADSSAVVSASTVAPVPQAPIINFHGPVKKRSCTDVLCLIVFLWFLAGWGYIAHFAFSNGDIARITHPVDSHGQICGVDATTNRSFLFYFDLTKCASPTVLVAGCMTPTKCVEHCPNTTFGYIEELQDEQHIDSSALICVDGLDKSKLGTFQDVSKAVLLEQCAAYYLPSGPVAGRCMPGFKEGSDGQTETLFDSTSQNLTKPINGNTSFEDVLSGSVFITLYLQTQQVLINIGHDFQKSWLVILLWCAFSALLSFVWILLLCFIADVLIWVTLAGVLSGLAYGLYYSYYKFDQLSRAQDGNVTSSLDRMNSTVNNISISLEKLKDLSKGESDPGTWLTIMIICIAAMILLLLVVIFLRKRIRTALAVIRASSRAIWQLASTLFFPILPLSLQLVTVAVCGSCALWMTATGDPEGVVQNPNNDTTLGLRINDSCNPNLQTFAEDHPNTSAVCHYQRFAQDRLLVLFQFVNLFGFLWGMAFADAFGQAVLAGTFSSYYWTMNKPEDMPAFPLLAALYRTVRYHLGSVALGSLLVAVVKLAQAILTYLQKKLQHGGENCYTRFVIKVCACCFYCLEKCVKFLNRYAYIMMAIFGTNFCASAKNAFFLIVRNALRVLIMDGVVAFFLFFGKLIIMGILGYSSYAFLVRSAPGLDAMVPQLVYIYVPMVAIILGSYVISTVFFTVYTMAIDTIFLCFLEDLERNDGTAEKPFHMSKSLMLLYGKKNVTILERPTTSRIIMA